MTFSVLLVDGFPAARVGTRLLGSTFFSSVSQCFASSSLALSIVVVFSVLLFAFDVSVIPSASSCWSGSSGSQFGSRINR